MGSAEREIERQRKVKVILKDIASGEVKKIVNGIKSLKVSGDDSSIIGVAEAWLNNKHDVVEKEFLSFFGDIKTSTSSDIIMDIINDHKYAKIQVALLSTIWNSSVDYSKHLQNFVSLALKSDFLTAFECLTIIENLEGPFDENEVMESDLLLIEFDKSQKENKTEDDQKLHLIQEIGNLINSMKMQ